LVSLYSTVNTKQQANPEPQHTCYVLNHVIHTGYSTCYGDCGYHQLSP